MTDEEIMIRAREAVIAYAGLQIDGPTEAVRRGKWDNCAPIQAAAQALRDLDKPLSEITPDAPIDPDLLAAREVAVLLHSAPWDEADYRAGRYDTGHIRDILAAIKRGRAAARAEASVESPEPDATAEAGPVEHYRIEQDEHGQWGIRALTPEMRTEMGVFGYVAAPGDHSLFSFGEDREIVEMVAEGTAREIAATIEPTKAGGA